MMKYLPVYVLLLESISLCQGAIGSKSGFEMLSVYEPGTLVTDHVSVVPSHDIMEEMVEKRKLTILCHCCCAGRY
jgi:hypothetical protein